LDDGTADGTAELVNLLHGFLQLRYLERRGTARNRFGQSGLQRHVISVERRVLAIVIERAVKLIGSRLDRGIDDGAGASCEFSRRKMGGSLELGNRIRIGEGTNGAKLRLVVITAVERKIVIGSGLTVTGQGRPTRAIEAGRLAAALSVSAPGTATAGAGIA